MTNLVELNDSNFDEKIQTHSIALIDFWTDNCQPCKVAALIVEELAVKYEDRIFVGMVRADKNPKSVERFSIRGVPTLLILKKGHEIDRILLQIDDIAQLMKQYVNEKLSRHLIHLQNSAK